MICPRCGYSGYGKTFTEGSTGIGILLCLCGLIFGIIYFIWQSGTRYEGCPNCRARGLVPLHSHEGHFAASRFYGV